MPIILIFLNYVMAITETLIPIFFIGIYFIRAVCKISVSKIITRASECQIADYFFINNVIIIVFSQRLGTFFLLS